MFEHNTLGTDNPCLDLWRAYQKGLTTSMSSGQSAYPFLDPFDATDGKTANNEQFIELEKLAQLSEQHWNAWQQQLQSWMKAANHWFTPGGATASQAELGSFEFLFSSMDPKRFFTDGTDEFSATIKRLADGPSFSDIGAIERYAVELTQHWLTLQQASIEYQLVLGHAWSRAFQTFNTEMLRDHSVFASGPRAVVDQWLAIANRELIATQRTEDYLDAQRRLLRAAVDYRLSLRTMMEAWCENNSIPTRGEVDDLQKTVVALRREVRQLKRQLQMQTSVEQNKSQRDPVTDKSPAEATPVRAAAGSY